MILCNIQLYSALNDTLPLPSDLHLSQIESSYNSTTIPCPTDAEDGGMSPQFSKFSLNKLTIHLEFPLVEDLVHPFLPTDE